MNLSNIKMLLGPASPFVETKALIGHSQSHRMYVHEEHSSYCPGTPRVLF